ncbi:cation transporter [Bacteroidia bacterium]|nr:cation transporter [Bacteroidia bacterium]
MSIAKIVIGTVAGSLAVLSDGLDSASDVVTSIVILIATPIISRPPNSTFVFGREKVEHVVATILSFVIFFMGFQMCMTAGKKIVHPETLEEPSMIAIWVILMSIAGKLLLAWYQFRQGKKTDSSMLKANAVNMRNDVIISTGVLLGLGFTYILHLPILDTLVALLISLYIMWSAVGIFREANLVLMDGVADTTIYETILHAVEKVKGVEHPHRIRAELIGNSYSITLDIEVEGELPLKEAHHRAQEVENSIKQAVKNVYDIVVHVEPIGATHHGEKFGINRTIYQQELKSQKD